MLSLSGQQLIEIMRRTLNRVDPRLVGHGERVAVVVHHVLKSLPDLNTQDRSRLCMLASSMI